MDSPSFFEFLAKATHETTTYAPLDNDGKCPYCMNPFYETVSTVNRGMDEVECLNCRKVFFIPRLKLI